MAFRQALGVAVVLLAVTVSEEAYGQGTPEIRGLVYDHTGRSGDIPVRALAESARVLNKAGIRIRWVPCPATSEEMPRFPDCRVEGANTITLRIIAQAARWIASSTLGEAMGNTYVTIFRDHVHAAAMAARCSEDTFLGLAITHEIGHLLLGPGHTKEGLMKPWWTISDCRLAEVRLLLFRPEEAARLRTEVMRRNSAVTPSESSDAAGGSDRARQPPAAAAPTAPPAAAPPWAASIANNPPDRMPPQPESPGPSPCNPLAAQGPIQENNPEPFCSRR